MAVIFNVGGRLAMYQVQTQSALNPFALAALWWKFADASGITQRDAMAREDARAAARREAQFESLGMRPPKAGGRRSLKATDDNKSKRGDG